MSVRDTQLIMGMPVTVEIVDAQATKDSLQLAFNYFKYVDEKFSTYKPESEISQINQGKITKEEWSVDMKEVFDLSEKTKFETDNYFDIRTPSGLYDPSGLVKGWAIHNAALILKKNGYENFYIEAGGDIETSGTNTDGNIWTVGIRNPFKPEEIIKVLEIQNKGIATSGTYERGQHIYNPKDSEDTLQDIASLSVIGPDIYEADRFATAAFVMGKNGIVFIENLPGFEAYVIDQKGVATMTSGFEKYVKTN